MAMSTAWSKSMVDIWNSLPAALAPYLDADKRQQMSEFAAKGMKSEVDNALQEAGMIDTLTADYIHAGLNESVDLQIKRLHYAKGDSILCVVKTWKAPEPESEVLFFTQDWTPLAISMADGQPLTVRHFTDTAMAQVMAATNNGVGREIEMIFTAAALSSSNTYLYIRHTAPLISSEKREETDEYLRSLSTVLRWDGEKFAK